MDSFLNFLNDRFGLDDLVDEGIKFCEEEGKLHLVYKDQKVPISFNEEDDEFLTVNKELKNDKTAIYNNYFSSEKNKLMEFKLLKLKSAKHRDSPFVTKHKYALNGDGFKIEISKMSIQMVISFFIVRSIAVMLRTELFNELSAI
ncbi:hypothetical protein ACG9XY_13945 [Acinetobacter seifertii]|uniref:hypothetical protein n=1 Tax=Acinetobacter seifertii TaxID=1530123 RepID=UPI0024DE497C|nr:hypothetical protein [Acinetobacter seifertii]MDV4263413.1 hypothetical protein [Acinetobacter seifertii]